MSDETTAVDEKEVVSRNFIEQEIDKDLENGVYKDIMTRFPPEPNGYLHLGYYLIMVLQRNIMEHLTLDLTTLILLRRILSLLRPLGEMLNGYAVRKRLITYILHRIILMRCMSVLLS